MKEFELHMHTCSSSVHYHYCTYPDRYDSIFFIVQTWNKHLVSEATGMGDEVGIHTYTQKHNDIEILNLPLEPPHTQLPEKRRVLGLPKK